MVCQPSAVCVMLAICVRLCTDSSNNGYFLVLFLQRAHSPFIKNGVNIELGTTKTLKALCMKQNSTVCCCMFCVLFVNLLSWSVERDK